MTKQIIDTVNELVEAMIEDKKLFPNMAKMLRKLYQSLLEEGFTEEQAIQIVANYRMSGN